MPRVPKLNPPEDDGNKEPFLDENLQRTGIFEISRETDLQKTGVSSLPEDENAQATVELPVFSDAFSMNKNEQPTGIFEVSRGNDEWKPLEIERKPAEAKKEDSIEFFPSPKDEPQAKKETDASPKKNRGQRTIISPEKGIDFEYSYVGSVNNAAGGGINQTAENEITYSRVEDERLGSDLRKDSEKRQNKRSGGARSLATGISKAIIYIIIVVTISVVAAIAVIRVGNDVFAFIKKSDEITVTLKEYATIEDLAKMLYAHDVIEYPTVFRIFAKLKKDNGQYIAGDYTITPSMNYDELLKAFKVKTAKRQEIRLTIPEGYTVDDIIKLFTSNGMGTKEGFVNVIQNYEFAYWFVEELKSLSPDRKYRLEGYLYPDTYDFYKDWSEETIINKLLANFDKKFTKEYRESCTSLGVIVDEVVNMASIIQMEAKYSDEYGAVSSVLHNRLSSAYFNKRLDCDATIQYSFEERKTRLEAGDTEIDTPYNTYIYGGLPPGPITNPTMSAIDSALYPDNTNYYYFVSKSNGRLLYATTYEQHMANIRSVME